MQKLRTIIHRVDGRYLRLFLVYFFFFFGNACYTPYINLYFANKGISDGLIGVMSTVLPLVALLVPLIWVKIADRTGHRKWITVTLILGSALAGLLYIQEGAVYQYMAVTVLYAVFATSVSSMLDLVTMDVAQRYGYQFQVFKMGSTSGYALGSLLLSAVIPQNLVNSFFFLAFFYVLAGILLMTTPNIRQPYAHLAHGGEGAKKHSLFADRKVLYVLFIVMSVYLSSSFYGAFLGIFFQQLAMPPSFLGICTFISSFSELPVLFLVNRLINRFGEIRLLMVASVVMFLRMALVITGSVPIIILVQCMQGWAYMLSNYCGIVFITRTVHPTLKAKGITAVYMVQAGLGSVLGNVIGGWLSDWIGLRGAYGAVGVLGLLIAACVFGLAHSMQKKEKKASFYLPPAIS